MPYPSNDSVPSYVPAKNKKKWREIWNSSYESKLKSGASKEKAEEYAFAVANSRAGPNKTLLDEEMEKLVEIVSRKKRNSIYE